MCAIETERRRNCRDSSASDEKKRTTTTTTMEDAHTKSSEEVILHFKTDENTGLSDDQIKQYQEKYGPNGKRKSALSVCIHMCVSGQLI